MGKAYTVAGATGLQSSPGPLSSAAMLRGLLLVLPLTAAAYVLARVPGLGVLGPLGLALLVAIGFRAAFGLPRGSEPGVRLFARPLLRVGIVLLGVRLDFGQLVAAGTDVLIVDGAVV